MIITLERTGYPVKETPLPLGRMFVETKYSGKQRNYGLYIKILAVLLLLVLGVTVIMNGFFQELPRGLSIAGPLQAADDMVFLSDLTFLQAGEIRHEQTIFQEMIAMILAAEEFIVADFFLFNDAYNGDEPYPELTRQLTDALIDRKQEVSGLQVVLITDEINNFYGSYEAASLTRLRASGVDVVVTDPAIIGNSNPLYSGIWTTLIKPFGSSEQGLFPNPFGSEAPRITLRGFLRLLNFKANHRKVLITEKSALVTSANPHDASAYHSNIAFQFSGPLAADLLATEKTVAVLSGYPENQFPRLPVIDTVNAPLHAETYARILTEGKIRSHLLEELDRTESGDEIWMGQFYIGDRLVTASLLAAAERGVNVRLILDPNRDAFGLKKNGIPNRPVAAQLVEESAGAIEVRWYNTQGEQYHAKLIMIHRGTDSILMGGSANLTKRNLGDKNLETMVKIQTSRQGLLASEVTSYFRRLWSNRGGEYTLPYESFEDNRRWRRWMFQFQEWSGFSTF